MPTETTRIPLGEEGYARLQVERRRKWATVSLDLWPSEFDLKTEAADQGREQLHEYVLAFRDRGDQAKPRWKGFPRRGLFWGCGPDYTFVGPIPKEDAEQVTGIMLGLLDPANLEDHLRRAVREAMGHREQENATN